MKPCFNLFTDKPQTQTNNRNLSRTCVVTKKRTSSMRKTIKPQVKMINKVGVLWQTHTSWYLLGLIIRQKTFPKCLCHGFVNEDVYKKATKACLQY